MPDDVKGGTLYGRRTDGTLEELPRDFATPEVVICRRVADFPAGQLPRGAARGYCRRCDRPIAYNPNGPHPDVPRICMQCAQIEPLPIES